MINGQELKEFQEERDLSVIEMCYFFGIANHASYSDIVKSEDPLPPTIAILLMLYKKHKKFDLNPKVDPEKVYKKIQRLSGDDLTFRQFSVMMGKFHTAYSSWTTKGVEPTRATNRLLYVLNDYLDKEGANGYFRVKSMIEKEAKSRDIKHLFSELSWN